MHANWKQELLQLSFDERQLEPESMEETAEDYSAMDFSDTNAAFVDFMSPMIPQGARVADMGTGPGDIAILLAQRRHDLSIVGVDLSPAMLELARAQAHTKGVASRLEWRQGDITKKIFTPGAVDFIFSHTTLHHLPDLRPFFTHVLRALAGRGGFVLRDLRRPPSAAQAVAWIKQAAGDSLTRRQFELFFFSLRASLTPEEVRALVDGAGAPGVLETSKNPDRYWLLYNSASLPTR